MSYVDTLPDEKRTIEATNVLEVINAEISFYRTRQMSVYYSAVGAQVLVVAGDRFVKGLDPRIAAGSTAQ